MGIRGPWCASLGLPWGGARRPGFNSPAPATEKESQALSHCTRKIFTLKTDWQTALMKITK